MRQHWPYLSAYLARGTTCWVATRFVVSPLLWVGHLDPVRVSMGGMLELIALSVGVGLIDTTVLRREGALLGNLAIHPLALGAALASPALLGELAIHAAAGMAR